MLNQQYNLVLIQHLKIRGCVVTLTCMQKHNITETLLTILKAYEDVTVRDRLRPVETKEALPFLFPKAPDNEDLRGIILDTPNRATEIGALTVIAMNLGEREGVNAGDVFRIRSQGKSKKDPMNGELYKTPEEDVGLAIVFRTFEKVSYALITNSNRPIRALDVVVSPEAD